MKNIFQTNKMAANNCVSDNNRNHVSEQKDRILTLVKFLQVAMNIKETGFSVFQSNNRFRPIVIWNCNMSGIIHAYARVNKYRVLEIDCRNQKQIDSVANLFNKNKKNSFKNNLVYHYLKSNGRTRKILLLNNFDAIYNNHKYNCILKIISDLEFSFSYQDTIDHNTNIVIVFSEEINIKSNFLFLNLINQLVHYRCFLNQEKYNNNNFVSILSAVLSSIIDDKKDDRRVEDVIVAMDMYNIVLEFKKKFMFKYYDRSMNHIYQDTGIYGHILLRTDDWDLLVYIFAFAIIEKIKDIEVYRMLLMSIGGYSLWDEEIKNFIEENIIRLI